MKFLIDVCAGNILAEWLRFQGHDVVEVRERNPKMSDEDILSWSVEEERILITMDKDFSELAVLKSKEHTGIIRLESLPSKIRIKYLEIILKRHINELAEKKIIIIQKGDRIRMLRF